jgi:hypothetical protein
MPTFRVYVNAKKGNEHVRVVDLEAEDLDAARVAAAAEAKKTEVVGEIVQLNDPNPPH